jgi:hypothetical protein
MTALSIFRVGGFDLELHAADSLPQWVHSLINNIGLFKPTRLISHGGQSMFFFCDLIGSRFAEKHCPSHLSDESNDLRNDCLGQMADTRQILIDCAPAGVEVAAMTIGGEHTSYMTYPVPAAMADGQAVYFEEVEYEVDGAVKMALGFIYVDAAGKQEWCVVKGWPTL